MEKQGIHKAVSRYLRKHWPDGGNTTVCGWRKLAAGWECDLFAFDVFAEGKSPRQHRLVVRLYPRHTGESIRGEVHRREYRIMQHLHASGYPVPRVYLEGRLPEGGQPFVIMQRIDNARETGTAYEDADPSEKEQIFCDFCKLLVRLHELKLPAELAGEARTSREQLGKMDKFRQAADLQHLQAALKWLDRRADRIGSGTESVVHWDYHPENVLLTPDGQKYVIDWSSAEVTDPRCDVGSTWVFLPPELAQQFLLTYQQISGRTLDSIEFFLAAACLRRLLIIGSILACGPKKLGLRPEVSDLVPDAVLPHIDDVSSRFKEITGVTAALAL